MIRSEWDRIAGLALVAAGAVFVMLGYLGVSDSPYVAEELAYLVSGGIGGLFLLAIGTTILISADLHDEWRKLDRVQTALGEETAGRPSQVAPSSNGGEFARTGAIASLLARAEALRTANADAKPASPRFGRALLSAVVGAAACGAVVVAGWNHAAGVADPERAIDGLVAATTALIVLVVIAALYTLWLKITVRARTMRLLGPIAFADYLGRLPASVVSPTAVAVDLPVETVIASVSDPSAGKRRTARDAKPAYADPERRPFEYAAGQPAVPTELPPEPAARVWVAAGLRHFHRPGCA
ncbi:MAG: hypothetical protein ACRDKS_01730, partial [Actinomycetota bacterium]